jgi:hypothetical protein
MKLLSEDSGSTELKPCRLEVQRELSCNTRIILVKLEQVRHLRGKELMVATLKSCGSYACFGNLNASLNLRFFNS